MAIDLSSILEAIRRIRPDMLQGLTRAMGGGEPSAGMGMPSLSSGMFGPPQGMPFETMPFDPMPAPGGISPPYELTQLPARMPGKGFPGAMPPSGGPTLGKKPARMPGKNFTGAVPPRSSASAGIGPGATAGPADPRFRGTGKAAYDAWSRKTGNQQGLSFEDFLKPSQANWFKDAWAKRTQRKPGQG